MKTRIMNKAMGVLITTFLLPLLGHANVETDICRQGLSKECLGKKIMVHATNPQHILAHPIIVNPHATEFNTQKILQVGDNQIIFVTSKNKDISCQKMFKITGMLEWIDMGGEPNTPLSYQNYVVFVDAIECL
ncbi:MAG: hypothetical protein HQK53_07390 [Oligoflexia bacterium]|nr:hypothetical protein [Oligoflexia bacterium]